MRVEDYQSNLNLASWIGGWESVNGNPDVYIFRGYAVLPSCLCL